MRVTNIDTLSNYLDRLITENIKLFFFKKDKDIEKIGTEFKSMFNLAQRTNPTVAPIRIEDIRIPVNTHMDVSKFNSL